MHHLITAYRKLQQTLKHDALTADMALQKTQKLQTIKQRECQQTLKNQALQIERKTFEVHKIFYLVQTPKITFC